MRFAQSLRWLGPLNQKLRHDDFCWFSHKWGNILQWDDWLKYMLKIVGFHNDIAQFPGVLATSETVQNTSSWSKESIKRTFRYEFLLGTHPRSTSRARTKSLKWPKNGKSRIFEMSSSVVVLISRMKYGQKWKVWVFLMCFAPLPNVLRPLHLILARCHFWSFFTFFLDFLTLMVEISKRSSSGWVLDYFFG